MPLRDHHHQEDTITLTVTDGIMKSMTSYKLQHSFALMLSLYVYISSLKLDLMNSTCVVGPRVCVSCGGTIDTYTVVLKLNLKLRVYDCETIYIRIRNCLEATWGRRRPAKTVRD